jgi:hypothetical protein
MTDVIIEFFVQSQTTAHLTHKKTKNVVCLSTFCV